ncbi:arabinogalactan protein 1 [Hordeum vulgare]|nr:arabinogalactan protein 1 [Hordeum vulgare]
MGTNICVVDASVDQADVAGVPGLPISVPIFGLDMRGVEEIMEMKKIACAVLIAASATVALAADGPAPSPAGASASAATGAFPAVGAVLGASVLSFFAYYMQ